MEKIFYVVINDKQEGPFSIEELKDLGLNKNSLVWREGLNEWVQIDKLQELREILNTVPPPLPKNTVLEKETKIEKPIEVEVKIKKYTKDKNETKSNNYERFVATEIKKSLKFILIAIAIVIITYPILFAIFGGFKFYPFYNDCEPSSTATLEVTNIRNANYYDCKETSDYKEWAKRLNMEMSIKTIIETSTLKQDYERTYFYWDKYTEKYPRMNTQYDQKLEVNSTSDYYDLYGNVVDFDKGYTPIEALVRSSSGKTQKIIDQELKNGTAVKKSRLSSIKLTIWYGGIVHRNVDFASENARFWSVIVFLSIFPGLTLLLLLIKIARHSKDWVDKNSNV